MKIYCNFCNKYRKLKSLKHIFLKKTLGLSIVYIKCGHKYKKHLKKKNQLKYKKSWFNY